MKFNRLKIFISIVIFSILISCSSPTDGRVIAIGEFPLEHKAWIYEVTVDGYTTLDSLVNMGSEFNNGMLLTKISDFKLFTEDPDFETMRYWSVDNSKLIEWGYSEGISNNSFHEYPTPIIMTDYDNPLIGYITDLNSVTVYSHSYELLDVEGKEVDVIRVFISSYIGESEYYSEESRDLNYYISSRGIEKIEGFYGDKEVLFILKKVRE
ncbi:MAG: hypothetical protein CR982_05295 [Candidatus Cloacimonadota bacterium]|nr:MAG: hypothetical protein CR982_05295 [Candidatus Cloacimonadota bacterium]PIE78006.1 MAG: hypothetical protein CSA15_10115 [Candidatus Delongbacteria bacterium]